MAFFGFGAYDHGIRGLADDLEATASAEVDQPLLFVDSENPIYRPVAVGQCCQLGAVFGCYVEVFEPAALRRPQEAPILQEAQVVVQRTHVFDVSVTSVRCLPVASVVSISSSVFWSRDWRWKVRRCGSRQSTRAR